MARYVRAGLCSGATVVGATKCARAHCFVSRKLLRRDYRFLIGQLSSVGDRALETTCRDFATTSSTAVRVTLVL